MGESRLGDIEYSFIVVTVAIGIFLTMFLTFLARNISLKSPALKLRNQEIQNLVDVLEAKNKKLSDISQQVKKASLVNDILDLSKIETGKIDLVLEQFDMCELITSVLHELKPLAKNNHNELIFFPQKQPGPLFSDVMRVRQILLNLIGNACKFTDQGAISVTVIQRAKVCVIKICDTGVGITEEQMKKLFKNFSQTDTSTT